MIELLDGYFRHLQVRHYSEETVYAHRLQLKIFCGFLLSKGIKDPALVAKRQILDFQVFLYERLNPQGKRNAPQTQNNTLKVVRVFYKWLHAEGRIKADPCEGLVYAKEPKTLPMLPPTTSEARRLMHAASGDSLLEFRDRCLLELAYGSALRAGEIRRLKVDELDLDALTVRVNLGKYAKSRVVPITKVCADLMRRYLKDVRPRLAGDKKDTGHLFVSLRKTSLGRSAPGLIVKRAAKGAQLTKRVFPHALRAACLTHMLRNSKQIKQNILRPLMEMAGHSDLTTLHRYTAVDIAELKEIHAKTHPRELEEL